MRKAVKVFSRLAFGWLIYLLALGPFWAIEGRVGFLPRPIFESAMFPARPLRNVPFVGRLYEEYLDTWYEDPAAPETTR